MGDRRIPWSDTGGDSVRSVSIVDSRCCRLRNDPFPCAAWTGIRAFGCSFHMHRRNSHKHWPRFDDAECVCVINCVNLLFESTYQHLGKWVLLFGRGNFHLNDSLSVELRLVKSLDRFLCALGRLKRDRRIASGLLGLSIQKEKDALRAWLFRLDRIGSQ